MPIDFLARGRSLIATPFRKLKLYVAIVEAISEELQDVYDFYVQIQENTSVSTSEGVQLDKLGDKHGEKRLGRDDDEYRAAIVSRIAFNLGSTQAEAIYAIAQGFWGSEAIIDYFEVFDDPSTFQITYTNVPDDADIVILENYANDLARIDPAGTRAVVVCEYEQNFFGFEGNADALGFGDGKLAGAWS